MSAGTTQKFATETGGVRFSMVARDEAEHNVAHYRSRLHIGAEPDTRAALLRLLLAEEKMLGRTREQLVRLDGHIERLQGVIAQQETRIGRGKFIGLDAEPATLRLATLNDLMATYQLHREWIIAGFAEGDGA